MYGNVASSVGMFCIIIMCAYAIRKIIPFILFYVCLLYVGFFKFDY